MRRKFLVHCEHCGKLREHKGRGLCSPCYNSLRIGARLGPYPKQTDLPDPMFCTCDTYEPEPIPFFGATQCAHCKRPNREEVVARVLARQSPA